MDVSESVYAINFRININFQNNIIYSLQLNIKTNPIDVYNNYYFKVNITVGWCFNKLKASKITANHNKKYIFIYIAIYIPQFYFKKIIKKYI